MHSIGGHLRKCRFERRVHRHISGNAVALGGITTLTMRADHSERDVRPFSDLPTGTGEHSPRRIFSNAQPGDIDDDGIRFIECGSDDGVTYRGVGNGIQRTDESEHTNLTDIGDTNLQRTLAAWHDPLFTPEADVTPGGSFFHLLDLRI